MTDLVEIEKALSNPERLKVIGWPGDWPTLAAQDLSNLADMTREMLEIPGVFVTLLDAVRQTIPGMSVAKGYFKGLQEAHTVGVAANRSYCSLVLYDKKPLLIPIIGKEPRAAEFYTIDSEFRAYMGVPWFIEGQSAGAICCLDTVEHHWNAKELKTAEFAARYAGTIAERYRRHRDENRDEN